MVLQNTKTRAATFTCCRRFHKNELELFLEDWPRRPPPSPDASGLPPFLHRHLIFYFFSIFCIQHISVSLQPTSTRIRQYIPSDFCLLPELYAFIIFSFEVFLSFHQPSHLLPASAGRYLTYSILIHQQARASRSGFACHNISRIFFVQSILNISPAITLSSGASRPSSHPHHSYPTKAIPPASGFAGQYHTTSTKPITNTFLRRPPPSPDASGLPPFPATLPQTSTPPIHPFFSFSLFFFSFFCPFPFSFFSFFYPFSFFFPFSLFFLIFIFSLNFLFFSPFSILFFCFFCSFSSHLFFSFFSSHRITLLTFCVHHPKGCKTERSSVSRSRGACPWRVSGQRPESSFLCTVLRMHSFCQAGRRILSAAAGDVHT